MGRDRYLSLWWSIKFVMFKFARLIICRSQICINQKSNIKYVIINIENYLSLLALPRWILKKIIKIIIKRFKRCVRYLNWTLTLAKGANALEVCLWVVIWLNQIYPPTIDTLVTGMEPDCGYVEPRPKWPPVQTQFDSSLSITLSLPSSPPPP